MNKKQTAVEWLINELTNKQNGNGSNNSIDEIYNQALQMEREQIEEAVDNTQNILIVNDIIVSTLGLSGTLGQLYYTHTYGECTQQQ